ncbi:hypothetical protein KU6B_13890 [Mameliella alba]|uniref:hypothetical protein n=1 Tax=Mameliella alba TaxID=561184 RepID=UPI0013E4113D|nr:hypothetical protein [Mameliella alba]BBU55124.1 hypothetical protein KU6B_13890 [Mameliella alba]
MATELYDHISIDEIKQGLDAFVPDIAVLASTMSDLVAFAISQPANVDVNEILFRPTVQPQKKAEQTFREGRGCTGVRPGFPCPVAV